MSRNINLTRSFHQNRQGTGKGRSLALRSEWPPKHSSVSIVSENTPSKFPVLGPSLGASSMIELSPTHRDFCPGGNKHGCQANYAGHRHARGALISARTDVLCDVSSDSHPIPTPYSVHCTGRLWPVISLGNPWLFRAELALYLPGTVWSAVSNASLFSVRSTWYSKNSWVVVHVVSRRYMQFLVRVERTLHAAGSSLSPRPTLSGSALFPADVSSMKLHTYTS